MPLARLSVVTIALGLLTFAFAASSASAAEWPEVGGCDSEDVEICQPVCVTDPCYGYVCVRHNLAGEVCQRV